MSNSRKDLEETRSKLRKILLQVHEASKVSNSEPLTEATKRLTEGFMWLDYHMRAKGWLRAPEWMPDTELSNTPSPDFIDSLKEQGARPAQPSFRPPEERAAIEKKNADRKARQQGEKNPFENEK